KDKREQSKSLALKAKMESSDEESLTSRSKDEKYAMAVEDFKKFSKRRGSWSMVVKKRKIRPKTKRVLWLKHLMRMDHGREFDNEAQFGYYCDSNGITHNFSAPHTPQSNGIVERKTALYKK
ncbi:retrovirus-related pol polyprotein from transposon TNT 1-94, partial [Tanacetum coccineum]